MKAFNLSAATLLLSCLLVGCGDNSSGGGTPPPRGSTPTITLATVVSGLSQPLDIEAVNDGSGRLLVVEQGGTIRVLQNGAIQPAPFLDIRSKVLSGGELGLLGLALHPNFTTNGKAYVNYTRQLTGQPIQTIIAEYTRSTSNPATLDPATERILITQDQPFDNHNGGQLAFGPDGFLYIGLGDGGSGGDPRGNGQNTNTLLGKILRIDVTPGASLPYSIPPGNPFSGTNGREEIFAIGFRNPWRFSFDRTGGALFVGDVGQNAFEEIDIVTVGGNYGWNVMEGRSCFNPPTGCNMTGLTLPIFDYGRSDGTTVIGGFVYRGTQIQGLAGAYIFGDFGNGRIWMLTGSGTNWSRTQLLETGRPISAFGQGQDGELSVADYSGTILQIRP